MKAIQFRRLSGLLGSCGACNDHSLLHLQGACVQKLSGKGKLKDKNATKQIVALLSAPLEMYKDIDTVLKLSNYPRLMEYLDDSTSKEMANVLVQNILKNKTCISTAGKV